MKPNQSQREFIRQVFGKACDIKATNAVGGGCIHSASKITLNDGRVFFLKQNQSSFASMFETEMTGLQHLANTETVSVPAPVQCGTCCGTAFLLMEWIEPARSNNTSSEELGRSLAQLHLHHDEDKYGFEIDNFIGSTPQNNEWATDWVEFFLSRRLEPQIAMAKDKGYDLVPSKDSFWQRSANKLNADCRPSLIHGDLWNGNYLIGPNGKPYLIDPAPYWGHHEAEFGILTLFGGFDAHFYDAYRELIPQGEGFEDRLAIYQLYHYLNHLNLFGGGYLSPCQNLLSQI